MSVDWGVNRHSSPQCKKFLQSSWLIYVLFQHEHIQHAYGKYRNPEEIYFG